MNGNIWFTSDLELVKQLTLTSKIIYIGEPDPVILNQVPMLIGSVLLPPYNALMYEMDGDTQSFYSAYYTHLDSPECTEFISIIMRALYNGVNITLYTTRDEAELLYSKALCEYLVSKYGIYVVAPYTNSVYDVNYNGIIFDILYQYNLCDHIEFFMNIPLQYKLYSFMTLNKLIANMNPYIGYYQSSDLASFQNFFNKFNEQTKKLGKIPEQLIYGGGVC